MIPRIVVVILAVFFFCWLVVAALARELPECQLLRDLQESYRGVTLTTEEKAMKVQAASWYRRFCRAKRVSR